jgi:hypothetical protein
MLDMLRPRSPPQLASKDSGEACDEAMDYRAVEPWGNPAIDDLTISSNCFRVPWSVERVFRGVAFRYLD